jgi:thioredoxin 1
MNLIQLTGKEIKKAKLDQGLVVVEFFGDFCNSCKIVAKSLEELAPKYNQFRFFKISAQADLKYAQDLDVSSLPTIIFFKDGKRVLTFEGYRPTQHLEKALVAIVANI